MSMQALRKVLHRAGTDPEFRKAFFADHAATLEPFDLTDEEIECLSEIQDEERLASLVVEMDNDNPFRPSDIRL